MKLSQKIGSAVSFGVVLCGLSGPLMAVGSDDEGGPSAPRPSAAAAPQQEVDPEIERYVDISQGFELFKPKIMAISVEVQAALNLKQPEGDRKGNVKYQDMLLELCAPDWTRYGPIVETGLEFLNGKKEVEERSVLEVKNSLEGLKAGIDRLGDDEAMKSARGALKVTMKKEEAQLENCMKKVQETVQYQALFLGLQEKLRELINK